MKAYANSATALGAPLRLVDTNNLATDHAAILDLILDQLAARVADHIASRLSLVQEDQGDQWLDSRAAANYLGISRDSVRRLAAEGSLPTEQANANCKLYFRRSDLDSWRHDGRPAVLRSVA